MAELSGLQVFKYLPAAKKLPEGNCKKCSFPTCMAFALKLAKGQTQIDLCPHAPEALKEIFEQSMKKPQKELKLGHGKAKVTVGGENVLYRHDKTFIHKTAIAIEIDTDKDDWAEKLERVINFEITRINETFKIDLVYFSGDIPKEAASKLDDCGIAYITDADLGEIAELEDKGVIKTIEDLTFIRKKAILEKDEDYSNPVMVKLRHDEDAVKLMSKATFYLCKYANILLFEDFNEALVSTLMTLRQNIYTDPQKPLQVESKVYEFNNPDENALVFISTNFALTYFAVASEIESLERPAYLVVTPSEGMSILTAWSAEKITANMIKKMFKETDIEHKVKNKKVIIPGLLAHMKEEIEEALPEFEIRVGTIEAYLIGDYVKNLDY